MAWGGVLEIEKSDIPVYLNLNGFAMICYVMHLFATSFSNVNVPLHISPSESTATLLLAIRLDFHHISRLHLIFDSFTHSVPSTPNPHASNPIL
jgi:hypothetical protein